VGIWNEAFDIEGDSTYRPPGAGTSVPGVERVLKAAGGPRRPSIGLTGSQP
jgi:type IV secretion system protein VirB9